jgi:hypothetical protein
MVSITYLGKYTEKCKNDTVYRDLVSLSLLLCSVNNYTFVFMVQLYSVSFTYAEH